MNNPTEEHQEAINKILNFLKMTLGKGLLSERDPIRKIEVFLDEDWDGSLTEDELLVTAPLFGSTWLLKQLLRRGVKAKLGPLWLS